MFTHGRRQLTVRSCVQLRNFFVALPISAVAFGVFGTFQPLARKTGVYTNEKHLRDLVKRCASRRTSRTLR